MATNTADGLTQKRASDVLRDTSRDSVGVIRLLRGKDAGAEREYEAGDEALVASEQAEWVVAPVHLPSAGRRLDGAGSAERETSARDGIEAYPPAEPTTSARRNEARQKGWVAAHSADGLEADLATARSKAAKDTTSDGDAKVQAAAGGLGARSGPVSKTTDLVADQPLEVAKPAKGKP